MVYFNKGKRKNKILSLIILAQLLASSSTFAATLPPTAGTIINQPGAPNQDLSKAVPSLDEREAKPKQEQAAQGPTVKVNVIRITGQTLYSQETFAPFIKNSLGKDLTLKELETLADQIALYFRTKGYIVANAYIPAQTIQDGNVEIAVVVGTYGKIELRNHSSLKPSLAESLFSPLKSGDYIQQDYLDRTLLLANDTSGLSIKATLAAGAVPGTSDLIIDLNDAAKITGQAYVDNWGNRYTGSTRAGLVVNLNNLTGRGDLVSLGGISTGTGMNNYNLTYVLPTGSQGARFGIGYSKMNYTLGDTFASLNANGIAKTTSLFESYVIKRSRNVNLNGRIEYNSKALTDRVDTSATNSQKSAHALAVAIYGDQRDTLWGGGFNQFSLSYSKGHLNMDSADAQVNDAYGTAGSYSKTNITLNRIQAINSRVNLYLSFNGQLADKNLDASEKLQLGGPTGVRAYPVGEAPCDEGYLFTGEFRWNLPTPTLQLALFYDNGKGILNRHPLANDTNKRILAGAGLGLLWNKGNEYSLRLDYAWKITTAETATADQDQSGRLWLQGIKRF